MEEEVPDATLVQNSLNDPEQYRHIINRYRQKLLRYVIHLGIGDSYEDILQEVFIKVYRNLNAYDDSFLFSSWIYRITHNEVMSHFRKKKNMPISLESFPDPDFLLKEDVVDEEDVFDPENITRAINSLDQKYKDVIVLKYFELKSYDEMADILQKPPGTIAILLNRAKQKLKEILSKNHGK